MIIVDLEMSGLDPVKNGIWQIGAVDIETKREFIEEARIDDGDEIMDKPEGQGTKSVFEVTGKDEKYMRDKKKQSQKELLMNFFKWMEKSKLKNVVCQNPQFDLGFIFIKAKKYGLEVPIPFRSFDLHSIAQERYFQLHGKFLTDRNHSVMNLAAILKFCGMRDDRGKHNALEDAKLEGECFSRIMYGKNAFPEYKEFKIPECLIK